MTTPCEEIDLTCSQEEDSQIYSKKRKDVVNLIDISPNPKKICSETTPQSVNEGDKTNTIISRVDLKKLYKRIQALEEMPVQVQAENSGNQYISRQEFDHLVRRVTRIEERVQNLEHIIGNVKAALLFPSLSAINGNSEAKVESKDVTQSTVRRHSAEPQYSIQNCPSQGDNYQTPQSSQKNNILETSTERNGLKSASPSTPCTIAKPQKNTSGIRRSFNIPSSFTSPNSGPTNPAISNSSSPQVNHNRQQNTTALSAPSSSKQKSSGNSARVQNGSLEIQEVPKKTALLEKQSPAQRFLDTSATATPINSSNSRHSSLGSIQTSSTSSRSYDTPQRTPTQRPPFTVQQDLNNQTTSNNANIKRNSAPSNSRSGSGSTQNNIYVGHQPGSSSSSNQNLPVDQNNATSKKQKKPSDYELPAAALRNIRIKREVESEDASLWRAIEPQSIRESGNFVVYIRGIGRKIRGQDTYVAVGGFSIRSWDRSNVPVQSIPTVCIPFVTELNKDDGIGPKMWDKLKTEALIMAAEKAIRYLKEMTVPNCIKVTIIASKSAKKLINIMKELQKPEVFTDIYNNADKCNCSTHPCFHRNRWDTNHRMIKTFVCNYDLPKLCLAAKGSNSTWREEDCDDLEVFAALKAEMDSQLSNQMNICGSGV